MLEVSIHSKYITYEIFIMRIMNWAQISPPINIDRFGGTFFSRKSSLYVILMCEFVCHFALRKPTFFE